MAARAATRAKGSGAKLPKLPKLRTETKIILGLLVSTVWISWRVRRGLDALPFGIGKALGGLIGQSVQGYSDVAADLANRPATQSPTALEAGGGVLARIAGAEAPPSISSKPDRVADESSGPFLGHPKNVLLVAGKVRFPNPGQTVPTQLASDTFDVDAALENQSDATRVGELELVVREKNILGQWQEASVSGGKLTIAPREFRQVLVRAPNAVGRPFSPLESNVRLRFAGYTLDSVTFRRTYSLL